MKIYEKKMFFCLFAILLLAVFIGCNKSPVVHFYDPVRFSSYKDVPGVTGEEIAAIEALREKYVTNSNGRFIYGMPLSIEAYVNNHGEITGFSALFCEWLTELFEIPFKPVLYEKWGDLLYGLETGEVCFTGELTPTEDFPEIYHMTSAIASRQVKTFRLAGSRPLWEIAETRLPRYGFIYGTAVINMVVSELESDSFELVLLEDFGVVYDSLKSGKIDAFYYSGAAEVNFIEYSGIVAADFYPLTYMPVSLSTQSPEFKPIISVVEKVLKNGGLHYLTTLYNQAHLEYLKYKLYNQLTEEEHAYIRNNPVIPVGIDPGNYPGSFYDNRSKVAAAMLPWLIGTCVLSFCVMSLVAVSFIRSRRTGKMLEELIEKRTYESKLQTTMLTTLFDSIPDLIFIKDLELRFTHCNRAFLDFYNRSKDNIIGKNDTEGLGLPEDKAAEYKESEQKIISEGHTAITEEYSSREDGTLHLIETIKKPLLLDDVAIGVLGIARDISKYKEMENKIKSRYEYSKKLSDALAKITKSAAISTGNLDIASSVIAQEGCYALNAFCVGIWKFIEEESVLECISCYDAYTGENPIQDKYNLTSRFEYFNLLKTERLIVMNNSNECKLRSAILDGYHTSICAALDAPIHIDGKLVGVVCVEQIRCNDFPEMREWAIEEQNFASSLADLMALAISGSERRKALDAAEMASQTKSSFLANMSHEIRTPMNAILGVTEILIQYESLPTEIEEGLSKIYSSCDLLLGIINDILDISKIEAGKQDIMPAQYKVASMINDSVQLNMMRIASKPIELELQVDENIPAKLIGDELRIKQILNNLLSNAFKYTDAGKITLSAAFEPNHGGEGITLVLSVRDTGHGMTKDQLGRMFEKYSRFNQKRNTTVEGTGLGLGITRRLINLMNGDINVESELGKGSFFTVRLPQGTVDSEVLGKEVAENLRQLRMSYMTHRKKGQIARDPMPYGSVLIVDDVETNLYVAVGLMKLYRLKIDTTMSGQEAVNKIKEGNVYDIIFMDHMMPEMDGIEATKIMRDLGYTDPIVALSANAVAGQADVFLQNGFDDFISKPIDIRQLNSVLNRLIRDKQPPEVIEAARQQKEEKKDFYALHPQLDSLLLESFIRDARKTIVWIEEKHSNLASEEVLRMFTVIVHGIKSSLSNIGETVLAELAYKLEKSGREQDIGQIKASLPGFLNDLRALLEKLEAKNNKYDTAEDNEDLCQKLMEIQERAADYDRKGALDMITEIKHCSKETKAVLDNIMERVLHSEFEEAENAAAAHMVALTLANTQNEARLLEKEIKGLNIIKGLQRYGCDEKTYLKVLRSYAASVRSMLGIIESFSSPERSEAVTPDKLNDYKIKVHGIKGTSLDIFAGQIGTSAKALEDAAKTDNIEYINDHNSAFLEAAWKMVTDIESLLMGLDAENPKPKKDRPDKEELSKLLAACKNYDMDGADNAMAEIEKFQYESDDGLADWLRESLDRMDLKQIADKLGGA